MKDIIAIVAIFLVGILSYFIGENNGKRQSKYAYESAVIAIENEYKAVNKFEVVNAKFELFKEFNLIKKNEYIQEATLYELPTGPITDEELEVVKK